MIVTLANTKGGVGKTTLAVNMAIALSQQMVPGEKSPDPKNPNPKNPNPKNNVLLVDGDAQATASLFSQIREEELGACGYDLHHWLGDGLYAEVNAVRDQYRYIIIDVGGFDSASMRGALLVSDRVLVPMGPRSFDLWALDTMLALVKEARRHNPALSFQAFLNSADARGRDNQNLRDAVEEMDDVEFLPVAIGRRKAFANASAAGLSVLELKPKDQKAVAEIRELICNQFGSKGSK